MQASFVGNLVCTSGAFTGQRCPVKVNAINETLVVNGITVKPLVKATHTNAAQPAAGLGDSGGPVYSQSVANADSAALAMGTISAGTVSMGPCDLTPRCFNTVHYADITKTLKHYTDAGLNPSLILS